MIDSSTRFLNRNIHPMPPAALVNLYRWPDYCKISLTVFDPHRGSDPLPVTQSDIVHGPPGLLHRLHGLIASVGRHFAPDRDMIGIRNCVATVAIGNLCLILYREASIEVAYSSHIVLGLPGLPVFPGALGLRVAITLPSCFICPLTDSLSHVPYPPAPRAVGGGTGTVLLQ